MANGVVFNSKILSLTPTLPTKARKLCPLNVSRALDNKCHLNHSTARTPLVFNLKRLVAGERCFDFPLST